MKRREFLISLVALSGVALLPKVKARYTPEELAFEIEKNINDTLLINGDKMTVEWDTRENIFYINGIRCHKARPIENGWTFEFKGSIIDASFGQD